MEAETPPKPSWKSKSEHKKYHKQAKPNDDELNVLEFVEEEEQVEVVPLGRHLMSSGILKSEHNQILRENIIKTKLVSKGQLFHLPIYSIQSPLVDPVTRRRPLEIREPWHVVHVQNLKSKMKINPHILVVPFLIMVDLD